jgi:UDP-glucose 4-epimerase
MPEDKMILVTGGAGFIGSTLVGLFLTQRNRVTVYDNFVRDSLSSKSFANDPGLKVERRDILDYPALEKAMRGADIVVHCAGIAGIDTVIKSPSRTMRVNMIGTANALEAARQSGTVGKFVDFSTSEVFGRAAAEHDVGVERRVLHGQGR